MCSLRMNVFVFADARYVREHSHVIELQAGSEMFSLKTCGTM